MPRQRLPPLPLQPDPTNPQPPPEPLFVPSATPGSFHEPLSRPSQHPISVLCSSPRDLPRCPHARRHPAQTSFRRARTRLTASSLSASEHFDHQPRPVSADTKVGVGPSAATALEHQNAGSELAARAKSRAKLVRRVSVGFALGAIVIAGIFSGPWLFAAGMATVSILGQQEYYQMVKAKGHLPATRLGRLTTALMMFVSVVDPSLTEAVFAIGGSYICLYLLFRRRPRQATIADVSTTFMGLFYAGYLPDFWVRLHSFNFGVSAVTPGSLVAARWRDALLRVLPASAHAAALRLPRPRIHQGAVLVFWSWLAEAFADIGAFFTGKMFGRTRLTDISPKKTVEGALGGVFCSTSISMLAAYLMGWPFWQVTGMLYGVMLGVVGLLGDLTESLFKRDAGVKDSGDLIPGHGGILDRTDSYVFNAPLAYYIFTLLLPALRSLRR